MNMENLNIGMINQQIANMLKTSNNLNSLNEETKNLLSNYVDVVKKSPILKLENEVINNISNKHIDNDVLAMRYIDNNIKLFETYTIDEIEEEHKKLRPLIDENTNIESSKSKLYESIMVLITESLTDNESISVDKNLEAITYVLNYLKENKKINDNKVIENINEDILKLATNKFMKKYESMPMKDYNFLKKIFKFSDNEKKMLFEEYKINNINKLKYLDTSKLDIAKINESIEKLNKMSYNSNTINEDLVKLYELDNGLEN